jgi:hypothetical protein
MRVKDLKKDQIVYECQYGTNFRCIVLEDARRDINPEEHKDGYSCRVSCNGEERELFEALEVGGYGLRLYSAPQYIGKTIG